MNLQSPERIAEVLGQKDAYASVPGRWSPEKAWTWYEKEPWLAGTNYYPATAINQIDMWQASTWDPQTISTEMGWARELGFNTHRVYLHDLVWGDDEQGLYKRMDQFLEICSANRIKPFFVFFDDCHDTSARLGEQPPPIPAYHNSGWVTCPERETALQFSQGTASRETVEHLKGYVQNTMKHFADDERILMWELYNEPGRGPGRLQGQGHGDLENTDFGDGSAKLIQASWVWAREIAPSQPICANTAGCVGEVNWSINYLNSDIHSIHTYSNAASAENLIREFAKDGRPLFMTEYLARNLGSTFQEIMPVLKKHKVAAVNWGFVSGKSGTIWDWQSRKRNGIFKSAAELRAQGEILHPGDPFPEPELWFHDILRADGTPFCQDEVDCIRKHTRG